uniref:Uncharacterized protein n=1 Tax=uncultured Thiotrichaceae bacterium TaxID=298394 RepID=A0A6S6UF53_9GAMM|nr:MAG: Unknown protein [uncultured Thiotrichaceae bacterium]
MTKQFYIAKDKIKFASCNKLISRGRPGSSSRRYATVDPPHSRLCINDTHYTSRDVVGISVNGGHQANRIGVDTELLNLATAAGATIIADNRANREREYNTGERDLAKHLTLRGYEQVTEDEYKATWKPIDR